MDSERVNDVVSSFDGAGSNLLPDNFIRFVNILRNLGVRVSSSEVMDAWRALTMIDILDREQVRGALRACLVKCRMERNVFELAFEQFFVTPEERIRRREQRRRSQEEREAQEREAETELLGTLEEWMPGMSDEVKLTPQQLATYSNMPPEEKLKMRDTLERMRANPVNNPGQLIARVMQSSLNYWRYHMLKNQEALKEGGGVDPSFTGQEDMDTVIESVAAQFYHNPADSILHKDMQAIEDSELARATAFIQRATARLVSGISRRYKRSGLRQSIDIRRTVRRNWGYGGVPIRLMYRTRRSKKPQIVLLCDVSASMAVAARFVLQFMYGFGSMVRDIEIFIFSEGLERVTESFRKRKGFSETMTAIINDSAQWGKSTDLPAALETLRREYPGIITSGRILLVISDTKTVNPDRAASLLREIYKRTGRGFWLNTVPQKKWSELPGAEAFAKVLPMFSCSTLSEMEKVLRLQLVNNL